MTKPQMVRDTNGTAVQALYPLSTAVLAVSGTTARVILPAATELVRVACTGDCHIEFGGSGVTATTSSMLFPAGAEVFNVQDANITYIAAIAASGVSSATLTATKML